MANKLEAQLIIAGAVSNSMLQSVGKSNRALALFGKAANDAQKKLDALARVDKNQAALRVQIDKLADAKNKLKAAEEALQNASGKSAAQQEKLSQKRAAAQIKVSELEKKVKTLTESNKRYVNDVRASYGPLERMRSEQDKLRISAERLNKVQERGAALERRRQQQRSSMANARAGMVDAMALAYAARGPINAMLEGEMSSFYLSTVLNAKDQRAAMQKSYDVARSIARSGIAGYNEAMDIQYALNSAGFTAALASAAAPVVASVAKITKGSSSEVGEIIATTYNNLGNQIQGNMEQKLTRIGELFTKTQFKFQIRDFSQIGESFRYAAAPIMNANANLEQSFTILGKLNDAGLRGGQAGTAFSAMMRQVIKGTKDYAPQLAYMADGTMDVIGTLKNIKKDMRGMDDATAFRFLSSLGGDEGVRALAPLLKDLDGLSTAYDDVRNSSKGIIDKNIENYLKTNAARIEAMKGSLALAAQAMGGAFGPAIQNIAGLISSAAVKFGIFAEKHPGLMKFFGTILAGAVATKLMYSGVAYFFGMFSGGITNLLIFWNWMQKINLAVRGIGVVTGPGIKAIAFLSKGFMLATKAVWAMAASLGWWLIPIAAVAGAAYLIIKHWDKVKQFFGGFWAYSKDMWSSFQNKFPKISKFIETYVNIILTPIRALWGAFKTAYEWGKKLFGLGDSVPSAGTVAGKTKAIADKGGRKIPKMAQGGFVSRPTLAQIGEKGTELVLPLYDKARTAFLLSTAGLLERGQTKAIADKGGRRILSDQIAMIESPKNTAITFAPTFIIQGNADEKVIQKSAKMSLQELKKMIDQLKREDRRVSLA